MLFNSLLLREMLDRDNLYLSFTSDRIPFIETDLMWRAINLGKQILFESCEVSAKSKYGKVFVSLIRFVFKLF